MKTLENLTRLYINKCQDYVKYRMVSDICKTKDFGMMARYFKNFAKQELTHAKIISDLINKIRGENDSIVVEISLKNINTDDVKTIITNEIERENANGRNKYKMYAKIAEDEGEKEVAKYLELLSSAEQNHSLMLETLLLKLNGNDEACDCGVCGLRLSKKDKTCHLCSSKKEF